MACLEEVYFKDVTVNLTQENGTTLDKDVKLEKHRYLVSLNQAPQNPDYLPTSQASASKPDMISQLEQHEEQEKFLRATTRFGKWT